MAASEAHELLVLAEARGVRLGCAPDIFLGGAYQEARARVDQGAIGTPLAVSATMLAGGQETWHPDPDTFYRDGAGPLLDMGPYYLTAIVALLGPGSTRRRARLDPCCRARDRAWPSRGRALRRRDADPHDGDPGARVRCDRDAGRKLRGAASLRVDTAAARLGRERSRFPIPTCSRARCACAVVAATGLMCHMRPRRPGSTRHRAARHGRRRSQTAGRREPPASCPPCRRYRTVDSRRGGGGTMIPVTSSASRPEPLPSPRVCRRGRAERRNPAAGRCVRERRQPLVLPAAQAPQPEAGEQRGERERAQHGEGQTARSSPRRRGSRLPGREHAATASGRPGRGRRVRSAGSTGSSPLVPARRPACELRGAARAPRVSSGVPRASLASPHRACSPRVAPRGGRCVRVPRPPSS